MNIFYCLPKVNKFCFCIGLRLGCIIIGLIHLVFVGEAFFGGGGNEAFSSCYITGYLIHIGYLGIALAILLLISIIYLLFGVITVRPLAVLCFMYVSLFWLVYNVAVSLILFSEKSEGNCSPPSFLASATLLSSLATRHDMSELTKLTTKLTTQINNMDMKSLYYFNTLPRVKKFFYCISLFVGCKIIGGLYMLLILQALLAAAVSKDYTKCYYNGIVYQIVVVTAIVLWCLTTCTTSLFLYGVVMDLPIYFIFFMDTTVLLIAFNLLMSFMMFFYFFEEDSCNWPFLFGGANFFGAVLLIYFLLVVNSHFQETVTNQDSTRAVFSRRLSPQGAISRAPPESSSEAPSRASSRPPSSQPSRAPSGTSSGVASKVLSAGPSEAPPAAIYVGPTAAPAAALTATTPTAAPAAALTATTPTAAPTAKPSVAPRKRCNVL